MASRTYFLSLSHFTASSSSRLIVSAVGRRSYASAAAVATNKNRPPVTARKTASTEHLSSSSNPKLSVKTASRTHVSAGGPAAKAADKNDRKSLKATGGGNTLAKGNPSTKRERPKVLSQREQLNELDNILKFADWAPTTDVWGQRVETLDVMIPRSIISSRHRIGGLKGIWQQFWENRQNDSKNMFSMVTLATHNALPGVNTGSDGFFQKLFKWTFRIFGTKSTKPTSWIAASREMFLENYKDLHLAIAKNDVKEIKRLTTDSFAADTLNTQKKHNTNLSYIWRLHRQVNPTQVVSLRVIEGYLASEEPKFGNRLMVHALVKFDTEQGLEIYDRKGNALHTPAKGYISDGTTSSGPVPAEKQHVVQYFVFEKRMWYDGPWVIREQIWDVAPKKAD
ncbi:hypothetical protein D9756_006580 [Leucocoprinus leucothites]|uniref:Tim44-like domain-containing protein n=1 Tax=Leucocoprinus leucothites TaxID=201217 RepID=A0A8H5G267_9AGAR|nr:hypothetical protein D9756_006580 [Leucoagaricus leucothites]